MCAHSTRQTLTEPAREIEICREVDVVVVGGGPAGNRIGPGSSPQWGRYGACGTIRSFGRHGDRRACDYHSEPE